MPFLGGLSIISYWQATGYYNIESSTIVKAATWPISGVTSITDFSIPKNTWVYFCKEKQKRYTPCYSCKFQEISNSFLSKNWNLLQQWTTTIYCVYWCDIIPVRSSICFWRFLIGFWKSQKSPVEIDKHKRLFVCVNRGSQDKESCSHCWRFFALNLNKNRL